MSEFEIFHGNLSDYNEKAYHKMYDALSLFAKKKADSANNEQHRKQRIIAYGLLDSYAKEGDYTSISHSGNLVYVAVSNVPVGIDVEEIARTSQKRAQSIGQSHFFTKNERERLLNADVNEFLRVWTFKEAYTKMSGRSLPDVLGNVDYYTFVNESEKRQHFATGDGIITICWVDKAL